jgi:hypothetical protein
VFLLKTHHQLNLSDNSPSISEIATSFKQLIWAVFVDPITRQLLDILPTNLRRKVDNELKKMGSENAQRVNPLKKWVAEGKSFDAGLLGLPPVTHLQTRTFNLGRLPDTGPSRGDRDLAKQAFSMYFQTASDTPIESLPVLPRRAARQAAKKSSMRNHSRKLSRKRWCRLTLLDITA